MKEFWQASISREFDPVTFKVLPLELIIPHPHTFKLIPHTRPNRRTAKQPKIARAIVIGGRRHTASENRLWPTAYKTIPDMKTDDQKKFGH